MGARPYQNFSALMTGINPVPGPRMGKVNQLYLRYFLRGGSEATFQHFSLTSEDNNHIRVSGLAEGRWAEVTLNFTRDGLRNENSELATRNADLELRTTELKEEVSALQENALELYDRRRELTILRLYLTPVMIEQMQTAMLDEVHAWLARGRRVDAVKTYHSFMQAVMCQECSLLQAKGHIEMIECYALGITR